MSYKKSFISNALILMFSGLIVRLLGFIYRIYISNLLGSEGMGIFQLISPVYSLIILTLTSGVSTSMSKMIAGEAVRRNYVNIRRITVIALIAVFSAGVGISIIILLNVGYIVNTLLKEVRTYYSILLLIPCIPIIALSSTLKGYFYGTQNVVPTALSQIAEQGLRISLLLFVSNYYLDKGLEFACAFATGAMVMGELISLLVLYAFYKLEIKKHIKRRPKKSPLRKRTILGEIFKTSLPISSNRFITSSMSAIELILIPRRLLVGGLDYRESMSIYGKLTGMAMPLIYFPCIITSSLAITLVPAISEALSSNNLKTVNYRISKAIQISFVLGFMFTSIFMSYPNEISSIIYRKENIGDILYLLAFTCIFIYLQQVLTGIMNGLNKQHITLRNSIIGYMIRIGFVYYLVPVYGIKSYTLAMLISYFFICVLNLSSVIKSTNIPIDLRNWVLKPGAVSVFLLLTGRYIYSFFTIFINHRIFVVIFAIGGNIIISLLLMILIGALEKEYILKLLGLKKMRN